MKQLFLTVGLLTLLGCQEPSLSKQGCKNLSEEIKKQKEELLNLKKSIDVSSQPWDANSFRSDLDAIIRSQQLVLDKCYAVSVDAGPGCAEFVQIGSIHDAKNMLASAYSLTVQNEAQKKTFLISKFIEQAADKLDRKTQLKQCF